MSKKPAIPEHLTPEAAAWYATIASEYHLESHHLMLLRAAAESWDRCQGARIQLAAEGTTYTDRHGAIRPHPAVNIERDARTAFVRVVRELGLDVEAPAEARPPVIKPNSHRRA